MESFSRYMDENSDNARIADHANHAGNTCPVDFAGSKQDMPEFFASRLARWQELPKPMLCHSDRKNNPATIAVMPVNRQNTPESIAIKCTFNL